MKAIIKTMIAGLVGGTIMTFGGSVSEAADLASWQRSIAKVVAQKQVYPRSALRREIEGQVRVQVTVGRSGEITEFQILEETGHEVLDREVPKLMERIDPLPEPPSDISDENLTFILPLSWVLQ